MNDLRIFAKPKQKPKTNNYARRKSDSHWCHSPCADRSVRSRNRGHIDVAENVALD